MTTKHRCVCANVTGKPNTTLFLLQANCKISRLVYKKSSSLRPNIALQWEHNSLSGSSFCLVFLVGTLFDPRIVLSGHVKGEQTCGHFECTDILEVTYTYFLKICGYSKYPLRGLPGKAYLQDHRVVHCHALVKSGVLLKYSIFLGLFG